MYSESGCSLGTPYTRLCLNDIHVVFLTGKNDGSVDGERYFWCEAKFGLFVRPEKLHIDRKGRAMRSTDTNGGSKLRTLPTSSTMTSLSTSSTTTSSTSSMRRSKSTADRLSDSTTKRSCKSKGDTPCDS